MGAPKKATHTVVHRRLHLAVGDKGKLQHVEQGSNLALSDKHAESLGGKVMKIGSQKTIDVSGGGDDGDDKTDKTDKTDKK